MKILRALPFVVVALFVVWASAVGTNPGWMWFLGIMSTTVAAAVSVFGYTNLPTPLGLPEGIEKPHSQKRRQQIIAASLTLIFSTLAWQWPFRACFWMARPALERIAQQAEHASIEKPRTAGLFTIQEVHANKGEIVLLLDGDGEERTILVRKLPGHQISRYSGDTVDMDSNWYFYSDM